MVIQSNMSPKAIVEVWGVTANVFKKYNIPHTDQSLDTLLENQKLLLLIQELNTSVGSSTVTCIEGG
jgi:hypothetical protein